MRTSGTPPLIWVAPPANFRAGALLVPRGRAGPTAPPRMSAPLLRRLQQRPESATAALEHRRWCSGAPDGSAYDEESIEPGSGGAAVGTLTSAPWSSGRRAAPGVLVAERLDDGLLVAETAHLPGEPIVWLGDVFASTVPDALVDGADEVLALGAPRIRVGAAAPRVEVVWAAKSGVARIECTVPCRPVGQRTFKNDGLDGRVHLEATEAGAVARLQPYAGLPALVLRFNGEVELEGPGSWHTEVPVLDRQGQTVTEDRYSPGTFVVRLPKSARSLRLTVEVDAPLASVSSVPHGGAASRARMLDLLSAPGLAMEAGWAPDLIARWIDRHAESARESLGGPGAVAEDDTALWLGRSCQLLLRNLRATWGPLTYRGLVEDTFHPAICGLVDGLLASPEPKAGMGSCAVGSMRSIECPGAARFRGARRWYEVLEADDALGRDAVAVEAAALLHQLFIFEEQLCRMVSDEERAERAMGRALVARRWFQSCFWLSTPRRLADLEVDRADPVAGQALTMRPGMLVAASLEGAPLDQDQRRSVVNAADERLLTPLGVRSMDREDPGFRQGSVTDGAVWPWLLGVHAEAAIRAYGRDSRRLAFQETLLGAIDGAPEAWVEDHEEQVLPIGSLSFGPATGESIRAFNLLSEVVGELPV